MVASKCCIFFYFIYFYFFLHKTNLKTEHQKCIINFKKNHYEAGSRILNLLIKTSSKNPIEYFILTFGIKSTISSGMLLGQVEALRAFNMPLLSVGLRRNETVSNPIKPNTMEDNRQNVRSSAYPMTGVLSLSCPNNSRIFLSLSLFLKGWEGGRGRCRPD